MGKLKKKHHTNQGYKCVYAKCHLGCPSSDVHRARYAQMNHGNPFIDGIKRKPCFYPKTNNNEQNISVDSVQPFD